MTSVNICPWSHFGVALFVEIFYIGALWVLLFPMLAIPQKNSETINFHNISIYCHFTNDIPGECRCTCMQIYAYRPSADHKIKPFMWCIWAIKWPWMSWKRMWMGDGPCLAVILVCYAHYTTVIITWFCIYFCFVVSSFCSILPISFKIT